MFLIEVAEIVRRWMWVFVRVEWEAIKKIREEPTLDRDDTIGETADYEMFPPTPEEDAINVIGVNSSPVKFS